MSSCAILASMETAMARDVYEVWDLESGNVLSAFPNEHEALALIRVNVREYGQQAVQHWMLVRERHGRSTVLGEGATLVALAFATETAAARRPSTGAAG